MLIMSQNKKSLYNISQMTDIYIYFDIDSYFIKIGDFKSGVYESMGEYKTEDRAKEILQEIANLYVQEDFYHINKSSLNNLDEIAEPKYILRPVSRSKIYYMPKE